MAYYNYPYNNLLMQQPAQPNSQPLIWVQGEAAAKSYLVAPGQTVPLWDSERQTIYLKSADNSGMPSMRVLDYTIRGEAAQQPVMDPIAALTARVKALEDKLGGMANESTVPAAGPAAAQ
jgi:hypothetical protein